MSDLSVLSHEYKRYADLARTVTEDVILLKRVRFQLPGSEEVTRQQREESRKQLGEFIGAIVSALSADGEAIMRADVRLPGALVERVQQAHSGTLPRFIKELGALHQHLAEGEESLTDRDVELLDDLSTIIHVETSHIFRRLWRK